VLRVGGNDVHNGRTPAQVLGDFMTFVKTHHDGKSCEDIWVEDRVHPNHAGYMIRVQLTRPFLGAPR